MTWPTIDYSDRRLHISDEERANSTMATVGTFFADLKSSPQTDAGLDAQLLYGEEVRVLERDGDCAKVASQITHLSGEVEDHYIGWIDASSLSSKLSDPTHMVTAPRTFLYPEADMKKPRIGYRSMGSKINIIDEVETRGTQYAILSSGEAIIQRHITPVGETAPDYVGVAERLLNTPYLWGGNTGFGIDCSGLVQLATRLSGSDVMRDTDMQAATIGKPIEVAKDWQNLQRGDLVFWRGHVAIAQGNIDGEAHLIHANGFTMDVTSEPALQAIERIAYLYEMPIGARRP